MVPFSVLTFPNYLKNTLLLPPDMTVKLDGRYVLPSQENPVATEEMKEIYRATHRSE